ncbi:nuclear transport factor 2 family protein [Phreatobacter sp.]|uniref:nuclear transport factor 2 family protein n=1 Tax=Phreatobacter sp. TaxID=1966341 RepID=UPI003F7276B8
MAHPSLRVVSGLPLVRERLARLYAERRAGNGAAFAAAFAEDGVFHLIGDSRLVPQAGPRRGRKAIALVVDDLYATYEYVDALIVDMAVDLNAAVIRRQLTLRSRDSGGVAEFEAVDFIRMRDGEIVELKQFIDTASLALLAGRI